MAYEDAWRIAQAFLDSYYRQKGFVLQKEETEYQRTVTERQLNLAEESADLAKVLQRKQLELAEDAAGRSKRSLEIQEAEEKRAADKGLIDLEFYREIMQAQLESLTLGNQLTDKKIKEEGAGNELADRLIESRDFYTRVSPSIFNAVLSGDREQIVNAFIQSSLDKSLIPDQDTIAYSLDQKSPILFDYFRKIVMDAATQGIPGGSALEEFRHYYGNLANIEDLLQSPLPKEKKARDRVEAIKETQRFFPGLEYTPKTIPEGYRGPML